MERAGCHNVPRVWDRRSEQALPGKSFVPSCIGWVTRWHSVRSWVGLCGPRCCILRVTVEELGDPELLLLFFVCALLASPCTLCYDMASSYPAPQETACTRSNQNQRGLLGFLLDSISQRCYGPALNQEEETVRFRSVSRWEGKG